MFMLLGMAYLVVISIILLISIIIWSGYKQHQQAQANVQTLAAKLGLEAITPQTHPGELLGVRGIWQGREVKFWSFSTGSGKHQKRWVAVGTKLKVPTDLKFMISSQGFGSKIMEMFGSKEAKVGIPQFDDEWFLETNQPELLSVILVPGILNKIAAHPLNARQKGYQLADGMVQFAEQGSLASTELIARLEERLVIVCDLADAIEVATTA